MGRACHTPLDVLAVVFLVDIVLLWSFPDAPAGVQRVLNLVSWIVWACFAIDYVARMLLSTDRLGYIRTHKLDLLMVLLPMLRLLRVFLVLRRALAEVSTDKIAGSIVSIVIVVVLGSAFLMWRVEGTSDGATITSFRRAVWWAVVTTTTVGWGLHTGDSDRARDRDRPDDPGYRPDRNRQRDRRGVVRDE